jgi:hypothetical protein
VTDLHKYWDAALIGAGSVAALLTSNKTLIFLTIVYTAMRILKMVRDPGKKE